MARQWGLPGERAADDFHAEMTATVPGASVSGVQMTVVVHYQMRRRERALQRGADTRHAAHGKTLRNGRTCTRA